MALLSGRLNLIHKSEGLYLLGFSGVTEARGPTQGDGSLARAVVKQVQGKNIVSPELM